MYSLLTDEWSKDMGNEMIVKLINPVLECKAISILIVFVYYHYLQICLL